MTHHLVSLARTAAQQLSQLMLLGPDAPAAQQQLQQLWMLEKRKRKKQDAVANGAGAAAEESQQQQRLQQEMTALARAWRAASGPNLSGFDVWIVLKKEAVPHGNRADPLASQQLDLLLKQQQQQRLQLLGAEGGSSKQSKKRHQDRSNGGDDPVLELLAAAGSCEVDAPKSSRAVLRSIPEQVGYRLGV